MSKGTGRKTKASKAAKPGEKSSRLGTRLRGKLADAYDARGHARATLSYHYSPKCQRDVVLMGRAQLGHFLTVEFDPRIVVVDYAPQKKVEQLAGEAIAGFVHAAVTYQDGSRAWRRVVSDEDEERDERLESNVNLLIAHKTSDELPDRFENWVWKANQTQPQRIHNSLRMVSFLAEVTQWPLLDEMKQVLKLVQTHGEIQVRDVMSIEAPSRSLHMAAAFKLVLKGLVRSDLTELPLSANSRLFKVEGATV